MVIRYDQPNNILVVTKGHPFDKAALFGMFDAMRGMTWTHVEHPAAVQLFSPGAAEAFSALVFYDVPGLQFRTPRPPAFIDPPDAMKDGFEGLLAAGKPLVFLHHALAGWPTWDRYAEVMGARFFYQPGSYKGRAYPDSGYNFPVTYEAEVIGDHPIVAGLDPSFELTDELYLFEMLEPKIVPLLRARHPFVQANFHSAANALEGRMWTSDGWTHGPGTDLIAWARRVGNSPIVYIQAGNDGATFGNPSYRKLLKNAIDWATSPEAAAWATERR
jgi:uncharacterized protein